MDCDLFPVLKYAFVLLIILASHCMSQLQMVQSWNLSLLNNYLPSGEVMNHYTHDLTEIQKVYHAEEKPKCNYPTIPNLEKYLADLSIGGACFIVIENFQGVNMNHRKIPIILRNPAPIVRTSFESGHITWRMVLGPSSLNIQNISVHHEWKYYLPCLMSKMLIGLFWKPDGNDALQDLCLTINHREYFVNAKPSNCYAHFGIFPPKYVDTHK